MDNMDRQFVLDGPYGAEGLDEQPTGKLPVLAHEQETTKLPTTVVRERMRERAVEVRQTWNAYQAREKVPYPLLFMSVLGSHAYGLAHEGSDLDIRGCHVLSLPEVVGLRTSPLTYEAKAKPEDFVEMDVSSHDVHKFCELLLKRNAGVLEELYSPFHIANTWEADRLRVLAMATITRHHGHHYLRLARNQWERGTEQGVKPKMLVYLFRAYLSGMFLMESGDIVHNMPTLVSHYDGKHNLDLGLVRKMMEAKRQGLEVEVTDDELAALETLHLRMRVLLEEYMETTALPDKIPENVVESINSFVIDVRLKGVTPLR